MKKEEVIQKVRTVCRMRRLSLKTERCYLHWILRFARHIAGHSRDCSREEKVRSFLEVLAPRSAASTQNQALNAVVFFYRDVLAEPLGDLGRWAKAKRPKRLPVWLSAAEMGRLLSAMPPRSTKLMAELAYGSGLRLAELLQLRIKDLDFDAGLVTVRGGKGDKDRVTCLPRSISLRLQEHLMRCRALWEQDRARGAEPVQVPDGLERKYPNAGREWPWFWVWPAANESVDPRSGIRRRHHVHEHTLGKALQLAARKAGLGKRVKAHALRHSFATNLLANGASITQVQELLGHKSVETTQVYLHCIPQFARSVVSPLDVPAGNVVPFAAAGTAKVMHDRAACF